MSIVLLIESASHVSAKSLTWLSYPAHGSRRLAAKTAKIITMWGSTRRVKLDIQALPLNPATQNHVRTICSGSKLFYGRPKRRNP